MDEKQRLIKYYLQQQMTSRVGRMVESRTLRSSRRLRSCDVAEENLPGVSEPPCEAHFEVEKNQIEPQRQQQMKEKNERDSTSIPNNENSILSPSEEKGKRCTRSSVYQWRKVQPDCENQAEPITPEGRSVPRIQLPATTKKTLKVLFIQPVSECEPADINSLTIKKGTSKPLQVQVSLYNQPRKSYRKIHKREIVSLPYRKCHDIFQGRIVTILNKIQMGKNCNRDLQSLVDRMQKISVKDMMNRYIISGIKTTVHFAKEKNVYDAAVIRKMEGELAKLEARIVEELERFDCYQLAASSINQQEPDGNEYRGLLIRKIYRIMKRKYPQRSLKENREHAIRQCERVLSQDASHSNLVKFIKEKMEIAY